MKKPLINNVGLIVDLMTYYCRLYKRRGRGGAKTQSFKKINMSWIVNVCLKIIIFAPLRLRVIYKITALFSFNQEQVCLKLP